MQYYIKKTATHLTNASSISALCLHRAQTTLSSKQYFCRNFLFLVRRMSSISAQLNTHYITLHITRSLEMFAAVRVTIGYWTNLVSRVVEGGRLGGVYAAGLAAYRVVIVFTRHCTSCLTSTTSCRSRWPPVTFSGGFPAASEFNKRLTASIDSAEREKERESRDSEIAGGYLGVRPVLVVLLQTCSPCMCCEFSLMF